MKKVFALNVKKTRPDFGDNRGNSRRLIGCWLAPRETASLKVCAEAMTYILDDSHLPEAISGL